MKKYKFKNNFSGGKNHMKKSLAVLFTLGLFAFSMYADEMDISSDFVIQNDDEAQAVTEDAEEEKEKTTMYAPLLEFGLFQESPEAFILSPGAAFQFAKTKPKDSEAKGPDSIVLGASYYQHIFTCGIADSSSFQNHVLSVMGTMGIKRHNFLMMGTTAGEELFKDLRNSSGVFGYMYQFVNTEHVDFNLGGGILVADLGIQIDDFNLYAIPFPLLTFTYKSHVFMGNLSVLGLPTVTLMLFPESMFRVKGTCGFAGFSSVRDLIFDCSVSAYPFIKNLGDLISFSAGISGNADSYVYDSNKTLRYNYYTAYGEINASALIIRAGWNFNGEKIFNEKEAAYDGGFFLKVQAMYAF